MNTKYSVLMSVYDKENPDYFRMSIESMLNQSIPPEQIVIVKDGKLTHELDEVIRYYKSINSELFTIISLEKNVGLGKALNEGLKKCRNELVARMDTDDISVKKRCELQIKEFIKNKKLSIVGGMIAEFYEDPKKIISSRVVPLEYKDILKFSRKRNPFNHPTVMFKKSAVLNCGGYGNYRRNQDFDLFVRMLNNGHVALNINKTLVLFRANKNYLKRRKSWDKCKSNIVMVYNFFEKGYSSLFDLIIVAISQLVIFISPLWLVKWTYNTFLRKTYTKERDVDYEY